MANGSTDARVGILEVTMRDTKVTVTAQGQTLVDHEARIKPLEAASLELRQLRMDFERWAGRITAAVAVVGFLIALANLVVRFWPK